MLDALKIAAKVAIIALSTTAVIAVVIGALNILPAVDVGLITNGIGKGKAILDYYMPNYGILLTVAIALVTLKFIAIPTLQITAIAWKWIIKVNT